MKLARAHQRREPTHVIREIRGELAAAKIEGYVKREVAKAPPLTDGQVERIGVLLRGGEAR